MSDDATLPADRLALIATAPPNLPETGFSREPPGAGSILLVQGSLRGTAALDELGVILDRVMSADDEVVALDLSGVTEWSTLAQAMVLHTARVLERRNARLVLVGASEDLTRQSRWLDIFERIESVT